MIQVPGADEIGKTTRSFFEVLRESPLSLALVAVIAGLIVLLYYSQTSTLDQRRETSALIIKWQMDTDKLMANCVSSDVTKMMLDNVQKITETMLNQANKDIARMQSAIEAERETNRRLVEETLKRLQRYQPPPGLPFSPPRNIDAPSVCDPEAPFCMPQ
jgi:hypothetical protein